MSIYNEIDVLIDNFSKMFDIISIITPKNLNEENNKFLELYNKGIVYNPIYQYNKINIDTINQIENKLKLYKTKIYKDCHLIGELYQNLISELLISVKLIKSLNNSYEFTQNSILLFGKPSKNLIYKSGEIINKKIQNEFEKTFSSEDIKKQFENRLEHYGFSWEIIITEQLSSSIAVDFDNTIIYINKNDKFSEKDLKRLVVHEIDTHVLRAENGRKQSFGIFKSGFPKHLETEEGLAAYNEDINEVLDSQTIKLYAGRVLGVELCLNNSFYYSYKVLRKYFSEKDTLKIVSRIKRGLINTKENGGFTKDYVYLNGYNLLRSNLIEEDNKYLYCGLVSYRYLDKLKELHRMNLIKIPCQNNIIK